MCVSRKPKNTYKIIFLLVETDKSVVLCNEKNEWAKFQGKGKESRILHVLGG